MTPCIVRRPPLRGLRPAQSCGLLQTSTARWAAASPSHCTNLGMTLAHAELSERQSRHCLALSATNCEPKTGTLHTSPQRTSSPGARLSNDIDFKTPRGVQWSLRLHHGSSTFPRALPPTMCCCCLQRNMATWTLEQLQNAVGSASASVCHTPAAPNGSQQPSMQQSHRQDSNGKHAADQAGSDLVCQRVRPHSGRN